MATTTTSVPFPRPYGQRDTALSLLFQQVEDRITLVPATTFDLSMSPIVGTLDLYKNGLRLDGGVATGYALRDRTVTLGTAAIAGDVFIARYYFRATRTV